MAGLLDFLNTGDPQRDAAISRGLLTAGLQLMQSKGKFLPALSQGGMAGLGGYEHEVNRQLAAKRIGLQDQYLTNQIDTQKREAELAKLPGQFIKPEMRGVDATGGMETAAENNHVPASMDLQGLIRAYMGAPGGLEKGFALQQALAPKPKKLTHVAQGSTLFDEESGLPVFSNSKAEDDKESPVAKLIRERDKFPIGDPTRKIFDQAIEKASTHQPAAQQNNYGSNTVPMLNPDGSINLAQLGNRADAPPKLVINPITGKPAVQPPPSREAKDPTEFQEKAGLYYKSMAKATEVLSRFETSGRTDWMQTPQEAIIGNEDAKTVLMSTARQKYVQAQRQWIDSINRVRSGANLPELEYHRAVRTFFPTVGENSRDVIEQKQQARAQEETAMRQAAGRAMKDAPASARTVKRTGTSNGRKVVEYTDGSIEYAD
jgi:hypothetical protein